MQAIDGHVHMQSFSAFSSLNLKHTSTFTSKHVSGKVNLTTSTFTDLPHEHAIPIATSSCHIIRYMALTMSVVTRGSAMWHYAAIRPSRHLLNQKALSEVRKEKSSLSKVLCSAYPAESRPPLTKEEEYQCYTDVQDLIALEKRKSDLESELGQTPSYQEWADYVGCSICHLYARIGKGRAAKRKMIAANLPLVSSIAKEFHGRGLSHQELCQEGAMGLMKSTEKFDISHNTKFSTYAYFWIRQKMSAAVQKFQSIWIVGMSLQKMVSSVLHCKDDFCQLNGRCPSMDELAIASKVEKTRIRQAFVAIKTTRTPIWNTYNEECRHGKQIADLRSDLPWRTVWQNELQAEFQELFNNLSPRELQVLRMRYGLYGGKPLTLFQIANSLNLTHEAVRKAEKSAFKKLRKSAAESGLQHYLSRIPH